MIWIEKKVGNQIVGDGPGTMLFSALFVIHIADLRAGGRCAFVPRNCTHQRADDHPARADRRVCRAGFSPSGADPSFVGSDSYQTRDAADLPDSPD